MGYDWVDGPSRGSKPHSGFVIAFVSLKVAEGEVESSTATEVYNEMDVSFTDALHDQLEEFYAQVTKELQDNSAKNTPAGPV